MNKNNPLVSVVMSVHNADLGMLKISLNSLINQTFTNFELILIDDVNPPNVTKYLFELSLSNDGIKYLKNKRNIGLTKSLIIGVKNSNGKYIARQDSDDVSRLDRLSLQVSAMEEDASIIICASWFRAITADGTLLGHNKPTYNTSNLISRFFVSNPICHSSVMFRKKEYFYSGGYDPTCATTQDLDLWFKLLEYGDVKFIELYLLDKYLLPASVTSRRWITQVLTSFRIRMRQRKRCDHRFCVVLICFVTLKHAFVSILRILRYLD